MPSSPLSDLTLALSHVFFVQFFFFTSADGEKNIVFYIHLLFSVCVRRSNACARARNIFVFFHLYSSVLTVNVIRLLSAYECACVCVCVFECVTSVGLSYAHDAISALACHDLACFSFRFGFLFLVFLSLACACVCG